MKIGVTGGCGYVGSTLLPLLNDIASSVEYLDLRPPTPQFLEKIDHSPKYLYVPCDLTNPGAVSKLIHQYDVVIHLAGLVGFPACKADADRAYRLNVTTTENLLRFKRRDAKLLFASTTSNYGDQSTLVSEATPLRPNSTYGATKKLAEDLVLCDPQNIVYRFSSAFGLSPTMRHDNLIHDFSMRAVRDGKLSLFESHYIRQFIHIEDMARAVVFAVENWERMQGTVYNVGNPKLELSKKTIAEALKSLVPLTIEENAQGSDLEKRNYPVSFEKLLNLGYQPQKPLIPALLDLVNYYRESLKLHLAEGRIKIVMSTVDG